MKTLVFLLILFSAELAPAGQGAEATITGVVASFDGATVKLYVHGQFVDVPRSSLKGERPVVGREVTAYVPTTPLTEAK